MSKEECNYEIYDREMLGLIHTLEDWRHFLEGISFEVIMDHKNMEWWATMRDLNRQQAWWSLYLSCFDFKITYRKGESMQADTLSRFAQDHVHDREDNRQLHVLEPQHFDSVAAAHYKPASTDTLGDRICLASQQECQEAALTRRTSWRCSRGGVGLGPSGKQLHPATPELTAWQERLADSSQ